MDKTVGSPETFPLNQVFPTETRFFPVEQNKGADLTSELKPPPTPHHGAAIVHSKCFLFLIFKSVILEVLLKCMFVLGNYNDNKILEALKTVGTLQPQKSAGSSFSHVTQNSGLGFGTCSRSHQVKDY